MAGNSAGCDRRRHRVVGDATRSLMSRSLTKHPSEIRHSFMLPLTGPSFPWGKQILESPMGKNREGSDMGKYDGANLSAP